MSDLNKNAKPFIPSGQSFGPIIDSSLDNTYNIPANIPANVSPNIPANIPASKKEHNLFKTSITPQSNDLTTQLIDEKHILITKNKTLEMDLKRQMTDKKYLNEKILNLNKQNTELGIKCNKLNADLKKATDNYNEVNGNFDKFKAHLWNVIKINTDKFEKELNEKEMIITNLKSENQKMSEFYMNYIQILNMQISNFNNHKS